MDTCDSEIEIFEIHFKIDNDLEKEWIVYCYSNLCLIPMIFAFK